MGLLLVSEAWTAAWPGAAAGVLALDHVEGPHDEAERARRRDDCARALRERYRGYQRADLLALPVLRAYSAYFRRFRKTYHVLLQLESVVLREQPLPASGALVEAMFMAELDSLLLTAGHDFDAIVPPLRLDVADGEESYTVLSGREQALKAGDMLMADLDGVICSVLCGQDRRTRLSEETRRALYAVYAPPGVSALAVEAHLQRLAQAVQALTPHASVASLEVYEAASAGDA